MPADCGHSIDLARHATCEVCGGMRLCLDCARGHLCMSDCALKGCRAGGCVKEIRDGVAAEAYGITSGG